MRASFTLALAGLLLLAMSCTTPTEQVVQKASTLEEAKTLAAASGGLIVLDFWKDG